MQINLRLPCGGRTVLAACLTLFIQSSFAVAQSYSSNGYTRENLVTDVSGIAPNSDPNLVNPWGIAALPTSPWWAADEATGLSTIYDGTGVVMSLVVTIPPTATSTEPTGHPTGIVANSTTDFGGSKFIFASLDGGISSWATGTTAVLKVDNAATAAYTGLTSALRGTANTLYAANFRAGTVEAYDTNFVPVALGQDAFKDVLLPADFAPFNVQAINGLLYVAFAKRSAEGDEERGPGLGAVDVFTPSGQLVRRLKHGPYMNAPWGVALAPADFGDFSNSLLVGQFGSGFIAAFDANTGTFKGVLKSSDGSPIRIRFLWGIGFGNGGPAGPTNNLYFAAGPRDETHGVFGRLLPN